MKHIRYERVGDGAVLTLDHPERMNAVSEPLLEGLSEGLDRAVAEGARAILLTGAGRAFCAGGTIAEPLPEDAGAILETHLNPLLMKLAALPVPLIAAVNGPAIGAGMSLALSADLVVAARSARFGAGFVQVGLVPDGGLSWLLARSIGYHRAMAVLIQGATLDAEQALALGLATRVVADEVLADETRGLLLQLASGPTLSLAATRRLVREALDRDWTAALAAERAAQGAAGRTSDFREGASAFIGRRKPQFTGA